ncbi:hypothetical protein BBJ28_00020966, partial [Nothophytophthora sp. Chile5]
MVPQIFEHRIQATVVLLAEVNRSPTTVGVPGSVQSIRLEDSGAGLASCNKSTRMDAKFIEEVAEFLDSFDLPTYPTAFLDAEDGLLCAEEPFVSSGAAIATSCASDGASPIDQKVKPKQLKAKRSTTPSTRELQKAKDRKRRNEYRERQKIEREALQRQVGELSAELEQVQKTKENEADALTLPILAWKTIAKRQLDVRLASEAQQRQLQAAVRARAALIQDLSGLVRKRLSGDALVENRGL